MSDQAPSHPGERFTSIFSVFMAFCVLVWLWGLGLYMLWPWQKGGQWLPEFPMVAVCADKPICTLPYRELAVAQASGRVTSLHLPTPTGETSYEMIALQWKTLNGGIETKASSWNFQTTVRYRIDQGQPILVEYQEISGKVFLYAIAGALISLGLLYARKFRKQH